MPPDAPLAHDLPCAACGYNLRGLARDATCPECGKKVAATIRLRGRARRLRNIEPNVSIFYVALGVFLPAAFQVLAALRYWLSGGSRGIATELLAPYPGPGSAFGPLIAAAMLCLLLSLRRLRASSMIVVGTFFGGVLMLQQSILMALLLAAEFTPGRGKATLIVCVLALVTIIVALSCRDLRAPPRAFLLGRRRHWGRWLAVAMLCLAAMGTSYESIGLLGAAAFLPVWGLIAYTRLTLRFHHLRTLEGRPPLDRRAVLGWAAAYAAAWGAAVVVAL